MDLLINRTNVDTMTRAPHFWPPLPEVGIFDSPSKNSKPSHPTCHPEEGAFCPTEDPSNQTLDGPRARHSLHTLLPEPY